MYVGIDIGTSGVKAVIVDADETVLNQAHADLRIDRPHPFWTEQDPDEWVVAVASCLNALKAQAPACMAAVRAIGLSGQMLGAVLLDGADRPLRPAILWNDGRSAAEARELRRRLPRLAELSGTCPTPGFVAPKLLWLRRQESHVLENARHLLLPKDYVRLKLTGEHATDMGDGSGTLLMDAVSRVWSDELLQALGIDARIMPRLVEGCQPTGFLRADLAQRFGLPANVVVAGGAGDNMAGAIGIGVVDDGQALVTLGTSGVLNVADPLFRPNVDAAVQGTCHSVPERFLFSGVVISAADSLDWGARLTGIAVPELVARAGTLATPLRLESAPLFLPYLQGERTPHNAPLARGVLFGLDHGSGAAEIAWAILEGVAFGIADSRDALEVEDRKIRAMQLIGGGARSRLWARMIATVLGMPVSVPEGGELAAALGAARLARIASTGEPWHDVAARPRPVRWAVEPEPAWREALIERRARFKALFPVLTPHFADGGG